MALSHPPLNQNTGRHSPAQAYPAHQLPYAHMQGQPGLQGQPTPIQITSAYPHPYTAMPGPGRPPQMMSNAVPMSSQQAQALAQQQQQQRQILVQQQQIQAQQAQHSRGVPPSPHHPSPSPHIAHQGFPGANGPGVHHFHQPPGVVQSPASMRQPQPHMQQVRPSTHPYQQPHQPQPGLNGMAQNGGQHMQHQQSHGVEMNGDAYAMARAGSGVQINQAREADFQLKLYILDFLLKSNCQQAAQHFVAEAGLGEHRAALNVPEGLLRELWTTFWDAFSGGKGGAGPINSQIYTETMNRLKGLRQQIPPVAFQPGYVVPNGQQPQPITQQQVLHFRQQQAQAHAQANGQPMMQQQMHQQNQQHFLQQQQQRMNSAPGPSVSPVPRPPQAQNGQVIYQNLQPPAGTPHSHSPNQPSPHLVQHPHPVMPSPHQKAMRPPMNGQPQPQQGQPQPGQPPMIRAMTPQAMQQGQPQYHPQVSSPAPMTPQQQQLMQQAMRAQGMIDPQAFQQGQGQPQAGPGGPGPQGQPQQGQQGQSGQGQPQQGQPQPGPPGGGQPSHQQLQAMQAQQMHSAANQMYAGLGLGQINPQIMHASAQVLGLQNRDVGTMSEDDRNRLISQYRASMQESQRRMMPAQQQQMMQQQQAQAQAHAQQQFQHQQSVQQNQQQAQQVLLAHAQAEAQSARMQQQQQQQQARMRANGTMPGFEHNQPIQDQRTSPPDRKRQRRNSGGASAPSPFAATPGGTQHMQQFGSNSGTPHQMNLQIGVGMPPGHEGDGSRQISQEARIAYEKQMHRDQLMRQNSLGANGIHQNFAPHTPNMSNSDAPSPAPPQPIGVGQSPRNVAGRAMQRAESKGAMLPPQSPATMGRSTTPKPGTAGKTPKGIKDEQRDGTTPKSLQTSPNNNVISIPLTNEGSAPSTHGFTPSPPSGSTSNATPNPVATISAAPLDPLGSVPSLSADSNSLSFGTDLATDTNFDSDFDFSSLVNLGESSFDFGQYLAELGDENDGGEVVVP